MRRGLALRWHDANQKYLAAHEKASDIASGLGGLSKVFRSLLQSLVLAVGAYLVINQEATAGIIIAGSILTARALAPVEIAIANWKGFVAARQSSERLDKLLELLPSEEEPLALPPPAETLVVEQLAVAAPGSEKLLLSDASFALRRGEAVGVIGPSGAGKSTLARALVGVWPHVRGKVKLDNAPRALVVRVARQAHRLLAPGRRIVRRQHCRQYRSFRSQCNRSSSLGGREGRGRTRSGFVSTRGLPYAHWRGRNETFGRSTATHRSGPRVLRQSLLGCTR